MDAVLSTCAVSKGVADVRSEPDASSELVTQALLNTPVTCGELRDEWAFVMLSDYEGWMHTSDLAEPAVKGFTKVGETCATPLDLVALINTTHTPLYNTLETREPLDIAYLSTTLPLLDTTHAEYLQVALPDERAAWIERSAARIQRQSQPYPRTDLQVALEHARRFVGVPYLWGGTSWQGIDCSALVQLCYRMAGYILPRDADQQRVASPQTVAFEAMRPGDLLFFGSNDVTHVGMALNGQEFIHAEGRDFNCVTISSFDPGTSHYCIRFADQVLAIKRVVIDAESN